VTGADTEFGAANSGRRPFDEPAGRAGNGGLRAVPTARFPRSLDAAELKAAYRFFDNEQVDTDGVLAPHVEQTLQRMTQLPVVLAVQDTTEFNLTHLEATEGLGYGTGNASRGFMLHSLLAVTAGGFAAGRAGHEDLGTPGRGTWARRRRSASSARSKTRRVPNGSKGIEHSGRAQGALPRYPDSGNRGPGKRRSTKCSWPSGRRAFDWLVRAAWDRRTAHPERYLWDTVSATAPMGETELQVPAQAQRREAHCTSDGAVHAGSAARAEATFVQARRGRSVCHSRTRKPTRRQALNHSSGCC